MHNSPQSVQVNVQSLVHNVGVAQKSLQIFQPGQRLIKFTVHNLAENLPAQRPGQVMLIVMIFR